MPFDRFDPPYVLEHFQRHGHEFGARTVDEYEQMADAFWQRSVFPPLFECTRRSGARCRYDVKTEEYSVLAKWGNVMTYFRPIPCEKLAADSDEYPEDCHEFGSNMQYFLANCD